MDSTANLSRTKQIVYAALPAVGVLLLLLVAEGGARLFERWKPPMTVDYGQGFTPESRLFTPSPENPAILETNPQKRVSFRTLLFNRKKAAGTLRIAAIGESSVNYLDYEFPLLADRLREELKPKYDKVEIINAGGLSYGSHRLVGVTEELLNYDLDLVLIYLGHNEFEELEQLDLANVSLAPVQRILSQIALYRVMRDRIADRQIEELKASHNKRILAQGKPDSAKAWGHTFTPQEVSERMATYRRNYEMMIRLCKNRGVPVVIGTIPSNLLKPVLAPTDVPKFQEVFDLYAKGEWEKGAAMARERLKAMPRHQSSDAENEIIRDLAKSNGLPLADVEKAVIEAEPNHVPGQTLFNDHCHLNPDGNKILIRMYEEQIVKLLK
jgi:lysophospholipase L1-like esterase